MSYFYQNNITSLIIVLSAEDLFTGLQYTTYFKYLSNRTINHGDIAFGLNVFI